MERLPNIPLYDAIETPSGPRHLTEKETKVVNNLYDMFTGRASILENKKQVTLKDLLSSSDIAKLVPNVIQQVTYEALIINLNVLPALFKRAKVKRGTTQLIIRAIGEIEAKLIPEGSEYPESLMGGGTSGAIRIQVYKYGTKLSITEEAIRDSQVDIIALWLRAAGRALARLREKNAISKLLTSGIVIYDNVNPADSEYGPATGRDIEGTVNGALTIDNLFEMYMYGQMRGFNYDTIIMSPLAWRIFSKDPTAREFLLNNDDWRRIYGSPAPGWETTFAGLGLRTRATGTMTPDPVRGRIGANPWVTTLNPLGATFYTKPGGIFGQMKVVVTPFMPVIPGRYGYGPDHDIIVDVTDIALADSNRTGIFVVESTPRVERWSDPERDIRNIKIYERYGLHIIEQGKGVGIARNISIVPYYVFDNVNTVDLTPPPSGPVLGES